MTPTGGMTPQNRTPVGSRTESLMDGWMDRGGTGPAPRVCGGIRFRKTYKVRPLPVERCIYGISRVFSARKTCKTHVFNRPFMGSYNLTVIK